MHLSGGFSDRAIVYTGLAFCLIAGGAHLFGLLTAKTSRFLGQPTYSLYLLHGLALYACFDFMSATTAQHFSASSFWAIVCGIAGLLIPLCHLAYRQIELPAMGTPAQRHPPPLGTTAAAV